MYVKKPHLLVGSAVDMVGRQRGGDGAAQWKLNDDFSISSLVRLPLSYAHIQYRSDWVRLWPLSVAID